MAAKLVKAQKKLADIERYIQSGQAPTRIPVHPDDFVAMRKLIMQRDHGHGVFFFRGHTIYPQGI